MVDRRGSFQDSRQREEGQNGTARKSCGDCLMFADDCADSRECFIFVMTVDVGCWLLTVDCRLLIVDRLVICN